MKTILIADDEPNIVISLEYLLQREGYRVEVARDGDEALQAFQRQVPDLVLLDVMMPRLSGYDVCQKIRENDQPDRAQRDQYQRERESAPRYAHRSSCARTCASRSWVENGFVT